MEKNFRALQRFSYVLIVIVFSYLILVHMKSILSPIVLAMLFSYLLLPAVNFFEIKLKFPRTLSILLALLIGILILSGLANLFIMQIRVFIKDFSSFKEQALVNLKNMQVLIDTKFHFSAEQQEIWLQNQVDSLLDKSGDILKIIAKGASGTIETAAFSIIFTFFMLFYRDRGKTFILKLAAQKDNKFTENLLEKISKVTIKYMLGLFTVVIILAITHSIVLSIIGIKYAVALGLLAAVFSFIPYFGTLISGLIPLTISLVLMKHPYEPILVAIYFAIITFVDHNILTPTITGGNVNLNPLATIIGLIIASEMWGIPGMIIIVPTLAIIKIICDNVEGLEPYGYILGIKKHGADFSKLKEKFKKKPKE